MTLLLSAVLLAVLAAGWVAHPIFVQRWGMLGDIVPSMLVDHDMKKRVALAALKDVEYDRAAGKLDETDYQDVRGRLELEALAALQAADRSVSKARSVPHLCGFPNPSGSRFCSGCGRRLG